MLCGRMRRRTAWKKVSRRIGTVCAQPFLVFPLVFASTDTARAESGDASHQKTGLSGPDAMGAHTAPSGTTITEAFYAQQSPAVGVLYLVCAAIILALLLAETLRRLRRVPEQGSPPLAATSPIAVFRPGTDSVAILDAEARVIDANPQFQSETGLPLAKIRGRPIWALHAKGFGRLFWDSALDEARRSGSWNGEARTLDHGHLPETENMSVRAHNESGGADITFEFRSRRPFKPTPKPASSIETKMRDALTGLPTRRAMKAQVELAIIRAKAAHTELALITIDLDRFRDINSIFGDDIGDRVLERLANALRTVESSNITAGRIGGDEFILLVEHIANAEAVLNIAHDISTTLGDEVAVDGLTCRLSASMGIAQYPKDGEGQRGLMQVAGVSLCHAKAKGRGQICFYSEHMEQRSSDSLQMEIDLRRAISDSELLMFYQPQVDLRTGSCIGAEALLRWQHPKKGLLLPGGFVPLAVDVGLTTAIDNFVIQEVCAQIGQWKDDGFAPGKISINISATTLLIPDFASDLKATADAHGLDLSQLEIEVLESTLFPRMRSSMNTIEELRSLEVTLAIDDFGTGYSSLAMLKDLPIDRIKLDRRFIKSLPHDSKDDRIVAAIIAMGRSLGINVIAEGVETREQRDRLISLGCTEAQGFLFSRPIKAHDFSSGWLKCNRPQAFVGTST